MKQFKNIESAYYARLTIFFAVAGMAGIFASTVRAPLTGLVPAVEMKTLCLYTAKGASQARQLGN